MRAKKTIAVERVKNLVNAYLKGENSSTEGRRAVTALLEIILHETGNYNGFNYLEWLSGGSARWREDGCPSNTHPYIGDESRVEYF